MKIIKVLLSAVIILGLFSAAHCTFAQTWTQTSAISTNWNSIASSADGSILVASGGTTNHQAIYLSTNSGTVWNLTALPMTNSVFILTMSADGNIIFTGRRLPGSTPLNSTNSNPLFLSINSGMTWIPLLEPTTNVISSIAMSANGNVLIVGMSSVNGHVNLIYISTDSGASWSVSQIDALFPQVVTTADGRIVSVFSSASFPSLLLTTTNAGLSWTTNNLPGSPYSWNSIVSSAAGNRLAAVGHKSANGFYVCTSTNAGISWATNVISAFTYYAGSAMASSSDGSTLVVHASGGLFISTNAGTTWLQTVSPSTNWLDLASSADGNKLAATAGETVKTTNGFGGIWTLITTPTPTLNLTTLSTNLALSWIIPSTNFVLQQSSDLGSWTDVTNAPALNLTNLQNQVMLSPSNSSGFYRLKTP